MTVQIQFRRGTTSDHSTFTGAQGEVTVNTTNNTLRVHDGSTVGGTEMLRKDLGNLANGSITNSQLANSSITINGTSVSLGSSTTISGGISLTNLSVTDTGGDGSLSYNNTTGVFTYTGPTASETRAHFSAGTGITITSGQIALQAPTEVMAIAVSDETTAITTGIAKITFRAPFAMTLTQIPRASLATASTSGLVTIDINEAGTSVLGANKLSIDANEKTSTTAATATTISDSTIADDAEITIDIDAAGTGAKGLKIYLYYQR